MKKLHIHIWNKLIEEISMQTNPNVLGKLYDIFTLSQNNDTRVTHFLLTYKGAKVRQANGTLSQLNSNLAVYKKIDVLEIQFQVTGFADGLSMLFDLTVNLRNIESSPKRTDQQLASFVAAITQFDLKDINTQNTFVMS